MTVHAAWERIEAAFEAVEFYDQLNPGASVDAIAATEAELGVTFPEELRESLARHDGSVEGSWPVSYVLLSLEGMKPEAKVWNELLDNGIFGEQADHDASQGTGATQKGWWNKGWIPLDADGGGNGAVIDTNPGPNGVVGQVLDMDHEVGPSGPKFASLTDYLNDIADQIEAGGLRWTGGAWERAHLD